MMVRRVMHMNKVRQKIWTWGVQGGYYLSLLTGAAKLGVRGYGTIQEEVRMFQ
jgi:hypothetical protein